MKLKHFSKKGYLYGKRYLVFKRSRIQSPTECYQIWLEDMYGHTEYTLKTLAIDIPVQLRLIIDEAEKYHYTIHRLFDENGDLLC
jgi:hypothetical protein